MSTLETNFCFCFYRVAVLRWFHINFDLNDDPIVISTWIWFWGQPWPHFMLILRSAMTSLWNGTFTYQQTRVDMNFVYGFSLWNGAFTDHQTRVDMNFVYGLLLNTCWLYMRSFCWFEFSHGCWAYTFFLLTWYMNLVIIQNIMTINVIGVKIKKILFISLQNLFKFIFNIHIIILFYLSLWWWVVGPFETCDTLNLCTTKFHKQHCIHWIKKCSQTQLRRDVVPILLCKRLDSIK